MANFFVGVLSLLAVSLVSARQTGSTCTLNMETIEKDMMECMAHDPLFMMQIAEHMSNPQSMESMSFVCDNKKNVVDLLLCMENKWVSCYPEVKALMTQLLPSKQRWEEGIQFMCENRNELESNCMNNQVQGFMQCYMGKLTSIATMNAQDMQAGICSIIRLEEQCIQDNHGSCTQKFVDLMIKALEKFFPMDKCPAAITDMKNQVNDPFGNILVHGQPLRFQPKGEAQYNIVQG